MENVIDLTGSDDEAGPAAMAAAAGPGEPVDIQAVARAAAGAAADTAADTIAGAVARAAAAAIQRAADEAMADGAFRVDGDEDDEDDEDFQDLEARFERMEAELRALRGEQERLADRDELQRHELEMLRVHVRRSNAERASARAAETSRRDNAFFDAMRRRFVDSWREDLELILKFSPHQLLFLGHLLQLPAIVATNRLE